MFQPHKNLTMHHFVQYENGAQMVHGDGFKQQADTLGNVVRSRRSKRGNVMLTFADSGCQVDCIASADDSIAGRRMQQMSKTANERAECLQKLGACDL